MGCGATKASAVIPEDIEATPTVIAQIDVLTPFVPTNVFNYLASNLDKLPLNNDGVFYRARSALVFVDMSGFTPLTERLQKMGRRGTSRDKIYVSTFKRVVYML